MAHPGWFCMDLHSVLIMDVLCLTCQFYLMESAKIFSLFSYEKIHSWTVVTVYSICVNGKNWRNETTSWITIGPTCPLQVTLLFAWLCIVYYEFTVVPAPLMNEFGLIINLTSPSSLTYSSFYHFRLIFNEKSGQEFVIFSSAWPSKMIEKTKVKDLKFKMKFYLNRKREKNKIKA